MSVAREPERSRPGLQRTLSLPMMTLYGVGTTVGAGIYALLGKVAGDAGLHAPLSFLLAALLALFTALTFAELSARFPKSAGEAVYVREGLSFPALATAVGFVVALAATISAATIANGFVGYFTELRDAPPWAVRIAIVAALGIVAGWGIRASVALVGLVTVIEVSGLLWILAVSADALTALPERWSELLPPFEIRVWSGIVGGGFLAFYAFLGFEDMVNVAEEVVDVRRKLPIAIALTLAITLVLYVSLALLCPLVVAPVELAASDAPLALVYERATGASAAPISVIGVLAMVNGGLVQVILASRVLYGLADEGALPPALGRALGRIAARTRTPLLATAVVTGVVAVLASAFPLAGLARATSLLTLLVFVLVNASLWRLKRRGPPPRGAPDLPRWVPVAGLLATVTVLVLEAMRRLAR